MSDTAKNSEVDTEAALADPSSPEPLGSPVYLTKPRYPVIKTNSKDGPLYVDHDFPTEGMQLSGLKWKRPKEICPTAQFIVDDASRMDVCQGGLNDCWFLSAVASLSLHPHLLQRVIPKGQSFQEGYTGSFVFRFWHYGEWEEVKIDDFLPTLDGQLVYLRSSRKDEFWSPLLEKAYAKLKGGYSALDMGFPHEAMLDMTGGVTQTLNVAMLPMDLVGFLQVPLRKGTLINCASQKGPFGETNEFGIMFLHAYSLTGVEKVRTKHGHVDLVRVHNPWGTGEWLGPWSDSKGPEWTLVSEEERKRLRWVKKDDGEFWMSVSDFRQHFDSVELCHLHDGTSELGPDPRPWHCTVHHGSWELNRTAGGPPSGGWFWKNPQFALKLLEEDCDPGGAKPTCSFLVALMQKQKRRTAAKMPLNVHVYQALGEKSFLSSLDLTLQRPVLSLKQYSRRAEVVLNGRLAPGNYIIIPSVAEANQEGEFLLRILTEKGSTAEPTCDHPTGEDLPKEGETPQVAPPKEPVLPSSIILRLLFKKHRNIKRRCGAAELLNLLKEVFEGELSGYQKGLSLELCKTFVALMDSNVSGQLDWEEMLELWKRFRRWTDIFVKADKNHSQSLDYIEIGPALKAAGLWVDEFLMQLIGLRYTEPDNTISYFGFLNLLLKLDSTICKFNTYDMVGMGMVSLNFRQWLHLTMYN